MGGRAERPPLCTGLWGRSTGDAEFLTVSSAEATFSYVFANSPPSLLPSPPQALVWEGVGS